MDVLALPQLVIPKQQPTSDVFRPANDAVGVVTTKRAIGSWSRFSLGRLGWIVYLITL